MGAPRVLQVTGKVAAAVGGLLLFVLALELLKSSAGGLGPFVAGTLRVDGFGGALGFGWLFAYVVLSGSPVAAIGLTFFAADVLSALETYAMIAGSRLGASLIVLFVGFLYVLRNKARGQSLEIGVLSLLTTYAIYVVAVPLGALALQTGVLADVRPALPGGVFGVVDWVYGDLVAFLAGILPPWLLFGVGVGTILAAFSVFDRALPDIGRRSPVQNLEAHVFRPTVMFAIGAGVTLLTLSVSVSLGLLVPLSAKGIARRENVIPYIMGANITTFIDTLFATLLIGRPEAFTIVLVGMLSVALVSLVILLFFFERFEKSLLSLAARILRTRRTLASFLLAILIVPLLLLVIR